jgi:hypothetical protein
MSNSINGLSDATFHILDTKVILKELKYQTRISSRSILIFCCLLRTTIAEIMHQHQYEAI